MWIWYLLLGSGSGSRTVGEFQRFLARRADVSELPGSGVVVVGREVLVLVGGEFY